VIVLVPKLILRCVLFLHHTFCNYFEDFHRFLEQYTFYEHIQQYFFHKYPGLGYGLIGQDIGNRG
jgi:hypothetical protein